jgi:hypothetical protein
MNLPYDTRNFNRYRLLKSIIKSSNLKLEEYKGRLGINRLKLLNKYNEECSSYTHGEAVQIKISIQNRKILENNKIVVGFSIRNNRGIEIFGSNTDIANSDLRLPAIGKSILVGVEFFLPLIAGGRYSVSVSLGSKDDGENYTAETMMPDCIFFDVDERVKVYTILGIEAKFSCEAIDEKSIN